MYPAIQAPHSLPWILTQVAANCGVSDRQGLPDPLQHFLTHDFAAPGLLCAPHPTSPLHPALLHHFPDFEWQNCVEPQRADTLISSENSVVCNSQTLAAYNTLSSTVSGVFCGAVGTSEIGNIHQELRNPLSEQVVLPDLSCPPPGHGSRNNFWLGATRMVSSPLKSTITVTEGDKHSNIISNSSFITKDKNSSNIGANLHINKNNNNNPKKKCTSSKRPPEPDSGTARSESEQLTQPIFKYEAELCVPLASGEDTRQPRSKQPYPCKPVDAKEVEKLLQDALWKGSQQEEKKSVEIAEATSSGGCDTGYSSRCSTPPGTLSLPADSLSDTTDSKQDISTLERRSRSPSSNSTVSQGSYRHPRQKRRLCSNGTTSNNPSSCNSTADHQEFHKNHHQQYHQPSHQVGSIHNNQYHHNHHQNHYHNQANGGGFGGNQYYNQQYNPNNFVVRECPSHQNRRYDRNYGNYGHHNNHYNRDYNYHNMGGEPTQYGRYNQGRGYHNRYYNDHQNYGFTQRTEPAWDRSGPLVDRAGTFSCEVKGDQRWKCEAVDAPSELLMGCEWEGLSQQVWDLFKQHQQTNKTFSQKMKLKEKVLRAIRNVHWVQAVIPHCRLHVVGSSLSGFGADWSDVDMCLMVAGRDLDQRTEATAILRILQRELHNCPFIEKMELIRAKVPILKFRDAQTQVDVDLNCNNAVGIRNTHLLNSYCQLDWRVRPLVLVVKLWAQHHNINNAKNMTISSYSLVLMVIHYLQSGMEPPVLPCLQKIFPEKFRAHGPVTNISVTEKMPAFTSKNTLSLGKLFHGFLDHFANKYNLNFIFGESKKSQEAKSTEKGRW
ncbi:Poly(A) RNA polymerase gld-2 A [Chionoecetes opilio]|uniref:Poly(A) RNA polymerase gld-2 A n=1 Tax=Chionoecetes opilio TaxID=41210 RepID=A0A8J4YSX5_CHIOP|nr:Poly(A) RNA polymerase gld-2 A [Chionoecetes opilio]